MKGIPEIERFYFKRLNEKIMSTENKLRFYKVGVAIGIFMALFFSYQIPQGKYQTMFKEVFLGISVLLMLVIMNHKVESSRKWLNIGVISAIVITMVLYLFEV